MSRTPIDDRRIEIWLGQLLRFGVLLSAFVVVVGAAIYLAHHAFEPADFSVFREQAAALRSIPAIFAGGTHLHGRPIIQLGLVLLIATPVARVVFSVIGFVLERDYLYVALTLIVLAVLLYSLISSGAA
jgi:uncharacterized membrane protein